MSPRREATFLRIGCFGGFVFSVIMGGPEAQNAALFVGWCIFEAVSLLMDHSDKRGG